METGRGKLEWTSFLRLGEWARGGDTGASGGKKGAGHNGRVAGLRRVQQRGTLPEVRRLLGGWCRRHNMLCCIALNMG
jgi:hypothetical protein